MLLARMTAEHALADSRREALAVLGRSPAADAARAAARRGRRGRRGAPVAAGEAEARRRCAERLLVTAVAPYVPRRAGRTCTRWAPRGFGRGCGRAWGGPGEVRRTRAGT
ncbi:hypothetical protein [Streptodolium elevatio]|uniref:Uncharacterized protein n=1 Tax=Streptodolium elevatio TaxID=3157996 RepID=A0ABV3DSA6_9ACTN